MIDYESIGRAKFGGALFLAGVFKVLAALTVVGGLILVFAVRQDASASDDALGYVIGATAVSASTLAFFGYVLEIAVAIFEETWHIRYATAEEDATENDEDDDQEDGRSE